MTTQPEGAPTKQPMGTEQVIRGAIALVALLFTAFGGYFSKIAPPVDETLYGADQSMSVGLATIIVCIIVLAIGAWLVVIPPGLLLARSFCFLGIAIGILAVGLGMGYSAKLQTWTVGHPPEKPTQWLIKGTGTAYTPAAENIRTREFQISGTYPSDEDLVDGNTELAAGVWIKESRIAIYKMLLGHYCALCGCLSGSIVILAAVTALPGSDLRLRLAPKETNPPQGLA